MGEAAGVTDDSFLEGNDGPDFPMNLTHANGDKGVNFIRLTLKMALINRPIDKQLIFLLTRCAIYF